MEIHFMLKSMGSKINGTTKTISKFILKWKSKENEKKCRTISHLYPNNQIVIKTRKNEEQIDNKTLNKHTWKCSSLARFVRLLVPIFLPLKKTKGLQTCPFLYFFFFSLLLLYLFYLYSAPFQKKTFWISSRNLPTSHSWWPLSTSPPNFLILPKIQPKSHSPTVSFPFSHQKFVFFCYLNKRVNKIKINKKIFWK